MDEKVILDAADTSHWLKNQMRETQQRDINDCLTDVEILRLVLEARLQNIKNNFYSVNQAS